MIDPISREAFWEIVEGCLRSFFDRDEMRAANETQQLRSQIEHTPENFPNEMIYHSEPFDVACDIADKQVDFVQYVDEYIRILEEHRW